MNIGWQLTEKSTKNMRHKLMWLTLYRVRQGEADTLSTEPPTICKLFRNLGANTECRRDMGSDNHHAEAIAQPKYRLDKINYFAENVYQ